MKVLATLHLADLFRDSKMRLPTRQDWRKVPRLLEGTWPRPIPPVIRPTTAGELWAWAEQATAQPFLVVDTEYNPKDKWLWLWGSMGPSLDAIQVERSKVTPGVWYAAGDVMRHVAMHVPIVYWNAAADLPVLKQAWDVGYADHMRVDDGLLLHAVLWSELPHTLEFVASLYSQYPKLKHLAATDPTAYHHGDLLATVDSWLALLDEVKHDPASWKIYEEQSLALLPTLLQTEAHGLRVNAPRVTSAIAETGLMRERATRLAQAYSGYPINVGSDDQLKTALYTLEGMAVQKHKKTRQQTIDADAIALLRSRIDPPPDTDAESEDGLAWESVVERVALGAHPLLEARVLYAGAQQVESHYLRPCAMALQKQDGYVYPGFKIHTQETGRWSITNPRAEPDGEKYKKPYGLPLQQLPKDLRDLVIPDEGEVWIGWDWSGIEEVLLGALSGEATILDAVAHGRDLHAQQATAIFGDKAAGREDYRTFTKRFKYRLYYLGDPKAAGSIPGARSLGLDGPQLVRLSQRLLSTMPHLAAYRARVTAHLATQPTLRTFMGRLRVALGSRGPAAVRELWNHQFQGGVADILNTTVVAVRHAHPWMRLVMTAHDAGTFAVAAHRRDEAIPLIKAIVERPIRVGDREVRFPAKYHRRYSDGREEKV